MNKKINDLKDDELIGEYLNNSNQEAFVVLYGRFDSLRKRIIKNQDIYYYSDLDKIFDDCFLNAVNKFDKSKNVKFSSFLVFVINNKLKTAFEIQNKYEERYFDINHLSDGKKFEFKNSIDYVNGYINSESNTEKEVLLNEFIEILLKHKEFYLNKKKNKKMISYLINELIFGNESDTEIANKFNLTRQFIFEEKVNYRNSLKMYLIKNHYKMKG